MVGRILFIALLAYFLGERRAEAYLDPGSGSLVLQIIVGGIAAFYFVLKSYWVRIKKFLSLRKSKQESSAKK